MHREIELHERRLSAEDYANSRCTKPPTKGMLVVFSGTGKGKSTAAFGMAWRAVAHGQKVGVVQFIGGSDKSAEYRTLGQHALCDFKIFGAGCLWRSQQFVQDKAEMVGGWLEVRRMMEDPNYALIICDEINLVIHGQYLNFDTIRRDLAQRRPELHMVFTGRNAPFELLDMADLATDLREVKHPFTRQKQIPQALIDY